MTNRLIVGIDLGTTNLKGVLCDADGGLVAQASCGYPTRRPQKDWVEQDATDWLGALGSVMDRLLQGRRAEDVAALGICSQVNTHVFVDHHGLPLYPAIVWQDSRVAAWAMRMDDAVDPKDRKRWWSSEMRIGPSHTLPRMSWMKDQFPDIWDKTERVLSPKDFLLYHLTGLWTTDPLSCFDLVDDTGHYIDALIDSIPGAMRRLPTLRSYREVIGRASHPCLKGANPEVVNGTMDAFGCLFGSGAHRAGEGAYISGTSEIVALISDKPGDAPGIVSFIPIDGWYVLAGPTQSGGDTLRWLSTLFGISYEQVLARAAEAERASADAIFLPHLQGERAPFWDSHARGTFLGLDAADGSSEMALAALEGVAYSARLIFERAQSATGHVYDHLFIGGSGNRSDFWAQLRADVFGLPLKRVKCLDTGCIGAAIMAGLGTGLFSSVAQASAALVEIDRIFWPTQDLKPHYDRLVERYLGAYLALKPFYSK